MAIDVEVGNHKVTPGSLRPMGPMGPMGHHGTHGTCTALKFSNLKQAACSDLIQIHLESRLQPLRSTATPKLSPLRWAQLERQSRIRLRWWVPSLALLKGVMQYYAILKAWVTWCFNICHPRKHQACPYKDEAETCKDHRSEFRMPVYSVPRDTPARCGAPKPACCYTNGLHDLKRLKSMGYAWKTSKMLQCKWPAQRVPWCMRCFFLHYVDFLPEKIC